MMRYRLILSLGVLLLLNAPFRVAAQLVVFDPGNFAQNVQQVAESILHNVRLLQQIELLSRSTTGSDFSLSPEMTERIEEAQRSLGDTTAIVFREVESLEQYRDMFPEVFDVFETLADITDALDLQNTQILDASEQAVIVQSINAEGIEAMLAGLNHSLAESDASVGQTMAMQVGNQISGMIVTMLAQMQSSNLSAQRLDALTRAQQASNRAAADEASARFNEEREFIGGAGMVPSGWE